MLSDMHLYLLQEDFEIDPILTISTYSLEGVLEILTFNGVLHQPLDKFINTQPYQSFIASLCFRVKLMVTPP
jgi:hypothetical protein